MSKHIRYCEFRNQCVFFYILRCQINVDGLQLELLKNRTRTVHVRLFLYSYVFVRLSCSIEKKICSSSSSILCQLIRFGSWGGGHKAPDIRTESNSNVFIFCTVRPSIRSLMSATRFMFVRIVFN